MAKVKSNCLLRLRVVKRTFRAYQAVNPRILWLLGNLAEAKSAMLKVWEIFPTTQPPGTSAPPLVTGFHLCALGLLRTREHSKPEEIKLRTTHELRNELLKSSEQV